MKITRGVFHDCNHHKSGDICCFFLLIGTFHFYLIPMFFKTALITISFSKNIEFEDFQIWKAVNSGKNCKTQCLGEKGFILFLINCFKFLRTQDEKLWSHNKFFKKQEMVLGLSRLCRRVLAQEKPIFPILYEKVLINASEFHSHWKSSMNKSKFRLIYKHHWGFERKMKKKCHKLCKISYFNILIQIFNTLTFSHHFEYFFIHLLRL